MRAGSLEFRPGLWPTLVTVVLLGILIGLGFWQLDRADQKRALLAKYRTENKAAVVRIDKRLTSAKTLEYQLGEARGRYDNSHQFLLDNRTHDGVVGYHVLTPLRLAGGAAVLINRGWIPLGQSRERLPDITVSDADRRVRGKLKLVPEKVFMLGEEPAREQWPWRVQRIDVQLFANELGYPLMPYVVLLDAGTEDGYQRDWRPLKFGPERNLGYAVQWFGLAGALLLIYFFVNTRRVK